MAAPLRDIPSLNGLRAVSIGIVVWGHAGIPVLILGSTGVTVFFFISGFLITTLLMREVDRTGRVSVKDFYLRRALRILPPLYLVLALAVVVSLAGWIVNGMTPGGLASTAFFGSNYYIVHAGRDGLPGGMNALWSLAVEEHYYLAFPVVFVVLHRLLPRRGSQALVLAGVCALVLGWRLLLVGHGAGFDRVYLSTDTRVDGILAGAVLALVVTPEAMQDRLRDRRVLASALGLAAAGVFFMTPQVFDGSNTYELTVEAAALAVLLVAVIGAPGSLLGLLLNWAPLRWVGLVSYSVYLLHRPLLLLAERYLPGPDKLGVLVAVAVSLALAELMRRFVENPCARLRRRLNHAGDHLETPQTDEQALVSLRPGRQA